MAVPEDHMSTLSEIQLQELIWLSIGLIFLILVARLALRLHCARRLFLDDYLLILAFSATTAMGAMHHLSLPPLFTIRSGQMPSADEMAVLLRVQFVAKILFWSNVYLVKLSLLAFLRTFLHALPGSRKWWYLSLCIVTIGATGSVVGSITECSPLYRNFSLADGCSSPADLQNSRVVLTSLTAWDIVTDSALIALPLPLLLGMRRSLTRRQLASLALVFSVGGLITIFTVLRLGRIWANRPVEDFPWQVTVAITWAQTEAAIAIAVGCAPAFKVLLIRRRRQQDHGGHGLRRRHRGRVVGDLRTWVENDEAPSPTVVSAEMEGTQQSGISDSSMKDKDGLETSVVELRRDDAYH